MKDYEVYSSLKVPKNSRVIVRLDGRAFHKLASDLENWSSHMTGISIM